MQDLFGGSTSSSSSQSGFSQLPPDIQNAFTTLANNATSTLGNGAGNAMFTPLPQTAGETSALNAFNQGFTPDATQLSSDIALQANPFDSSVIDTINQQAEGQNSQLQSALDRAGQFGSNRADLGANNIDLSRLQQIGTFKQNEFNSAISNALNALPNLRRQDALDQLQGGAFQRNLNTQTEQAPVNALQAYANLLRSLPQNGGTISTVSGDTTQGALSGFRGSSPSNGDSGNGFGGSAIGNVANLFSALF